MAAGGRKAQKPRCPPRHEPPLIWDEPLGVRGLAGAGGRAWLCLWRRPQPKALPLSRVLEGGAAFQGAALGGQARHPGQG